MKLRIVLMSDTHQHPLSEWVIPDGDVFIHSGDFMKGKKLKAVTAFNRELSKLPHKHKLIVPGNHDWPFERQREAAIAELTAATYLEDREIVIDGVKFYGSPWQPEYRNWAFNLPRGSLELRAKWKAIPDDVDVLITHTPPNTVRDMVWPRGEQVGCAQLRWRMEEISPILHTFGHVHGGRGDEMVNSTLCINAASTDEGYKVVPTVIVVDIDTETRTATIVQQ